MTRQGIPSNDSNFKDHIVIKCPYRAVVVGRTNTIAYDNGLSRTLTDLNAVLRLLACNV